MADRTGPDAAPAPWLSPAAPAEPPPWHPPAQAAPQGWARPGPAPSSWSSDLDPIDEPEPRPRRGRALPWVVGLAAAGVLAVGGYAVVDRSAPDDAVTAASDGDAPVFGAPSSGTPSSAASSSAAPSQTPETSPSPEAGASSAVPRPTGPPSTLQPVSVTATCRAPDGVDSAGSTVTYQPEHTLDGVPATAWRCPGAAVDAQLTFDFGGPVLLASAGLVPGYAKIDPADGTNRFTENRTVTAVTWEFDDGTSSGQSVPAPQPSLATSHLPAPVSTTRVVLRIADTGNDTALRDFTAISDVQFTGYR
ncbi:hypothetical protein JOD57_002802 [Geodermatophilus bullaregiensis]|uniref:hypothetical protein n=1 Tax=Geodermatophilus bullaregiensis TaxID=1564160 RepID=UPI00195BDF04|nr:hypothetical protein [Geodermatophilus bullaregiensis]MBM7806965.1 hypothetical protein [Geodermatophilus bullaregiensis]